MMVSENQNVGFIGFVTRKDKDTGVNLLAKIVTPNKKRALNKIVRVKVKANALDDYSCCVIDHAAMKKNIEDSQDLESVNESFQFFYNGEHGTSVSYAIEKLDEHSTINQYLNEDGTLTGRPKYNPTGAADAVGYIRITVTKNDAEVSSRIMVRIKGMTAEEVLNSDKIYSKYKGSLSEFLWDSIAGSNGLYSSKGYTEINSQLCFKNTDQIFVPEISETPITCTWTIDYDEVGNFMKNDSTKFPGIYQLETTGGGSRICMDKDDSENYGRVYQPTYKDTCDYLTNNGYAELITTNENEARNRRFRIGKTDTLSPNGKLRLRATLTLGEAQPVEVHYMCATTSKTMTTSEVADFIQNNVMQIGFNDIWRACDNEPISIYVPQMSQDDSGATAQKISIYGNGHFTALSLDQYRILRLDRLTLSNIVSLYNNPTIYKVEKEGSSYKISPSIYDVTPMFEPAYFVMQNETINGLDVTDNTRTLTIPIGTLAGKTGLYKADEILNSYPDLSAFAIKFTIEVQSLGTGQDAIYLDFSKIFTLNRLS